MKISEFRKLIREEIQKVIAEADPADAFVDKSAKVPKDTLKKSLIHLKSKLTPQGWAVLEKFMSGAAAMGWNRAYKVLQLAAVFGFKPAAMVLGPADRELIVSKSIKLGDLDSYANKTLRDLITVTKDLIPDPDNTKRYIAK